MIVNICETVFILGPGNLKYYLWYFGGRKITPFKIACDIFYYLEIRVKAL